MPFSITITVGGESVFAELNETETALAIVDALPIEAEFNTWGDEIYFTIPVETGLEDGRDFVRAGDLGYWPPGNAFCIFYGATPGSADGEIRPASPVNVVGRIEGDPTVFRGLAKRVSTVRIERM